MSYTLQEKVEDILKTIPETRNSDIELMIEIWKKYHKSRLVAFQPVDNSGTCYSVPLGNIKFLPREDHIKRIRARFNQEGKYLPTTLEVAEKRKMNILEWRAALGYRG